MQSAQRKYDYHVPADRPGKRIVKMEGNVAYINNGFAKQKVRQPKAVVKKAAKQRKSGVFSTLCVLFIAFCALAVLVSRYAAVCSIAAENNALEQEINMIEAKIDTLKVDIELKDDLEYVHNTARQELGMIYPTQDQKISIDIGG